MGTKIWLNLGTSRYITNNVQSQNPDSQLPLLLHYNTKVLITTQRPLLQLIVAAATVTTTTT